MGEGCYAVEDQNHFPLPSEKSLDVSLEKILMDSLTKAAHLTKDMVKKRSNPKNQQGSLTKEYPSL